MVFQSSSPNVEIRMEAPLHPFFVAVHENPRIVNRCTGYGHPLFTKQFPIFFGPLDSNVTSWLNVIARNFVFDLNQNVVLPPVKKKTKRLFKKLGFDPAANPHVFDFWLYLIWIYRRSQGLPLFLDGVFQFMKGNNIDEVKAVVLGNEPAPRTLSSGYAYHGSVSESTRALVQFLDREMTFLGSVAPNVITKALGDCLLDGWVGEGVLLMNACLTFEHPQSWRRSAWGILTNFFLKYINDTRCNIVFILTGRRACRRQDLIDQGKHLVIPVLHPSWYSYSQSRGGPPGPENSELDWRVVLPFLNSNFYRYQTTRKMEALIDWCNIDGTRDSRNERIGRLVDFFNRMIDQHRSKWGLASRLALRAYQSSDGIWKVDAIDENRNE